MTDTTDIKVLRERAKKINHRLDVVMGALSPFNPDESAHWDCEKLICDLISQLEAERQRADDAHKYGSERDSENESLMHTVGRLRVEIAELKGEQVPAAAGTAEKCSPDVYAKGASACLVDIPKEKAEVICRGISAASGVAVDWHYVGGRVHIKAMRVTAPQKPVISRIDFESYYSGIMGTPMSVLKVLRNGDSYSETEGERLSLAWSAYQAAIEAAGGIVKDGE